MSQQRRSIEDEPFLLVRTSGVDVSEGYAIARHVHDWHQLVYVRSGLVRVQTGDGSWSTPPTWAVWVPRGTPHSIRFTGRTELRTAYVRPDWRLDLPHDCRALPVSPLLREVVLRTSALGALDARVASEAALAELLVADLGSAGPPPVVLPEPTSASVVQVADRIRADVANAPGTALLARGVGLSPRTLERRFRAETGMSLGRWRQQQMLFAGLRQMAAGTSVAAAALAAGYRSSSAFIAAFRATFGVTPARYLAGQPPAPSAHL